jgi:hypothetical protein
MSVTTSGPTFHDPEEQLLTEIQDLVDAAVQSVCEDHYDAPTQEPPTTARIAQAIEIAIKQHPINVNGLTVEVATQDVPSLGSKMEKRIGGDLYISLVRRDKEIPVSKGLLVQAKWDRKLTRDPLLPGQAARMRNRTRESYIWSYGPHGVTSIPAGAMIGVAPLRDILSAGELIAEGLRCRKGDPQIGRDLSLPRPLAMNAMLKRLNAQAALEIEVEHTDR